MSPVRNAAFLRETEIAILNAPFEEDGWRSALTTISRACNSSAANLVGFGGPLRLSLNLFTGRESERAERYFSRPELWGPSNWRVQSTGPAMSIQYEEHYSAYRQRTATSDYDDAVSDLDIPFGCQSPIIADSSSFLGLALLRSQREGPCSPEIVSLFSRLIHHVQRASRVEMALGGEAAELMLGEFEGLHGATLLLDRHGNLCALSPAAEQLFEAGGPLRLAGLNVRLSDRREDDSLQKSLGRLLASDGYRDPIVHEMPLGRAGGVGPLWRLFAVRLPHREHGLGFEPHLAISLKQAEQVAGAQRREAA